MDDRFNSGNSSEPVNSSNENSGYTVTSGGGYYSSAQNFKSDENTPPPPNFILKESVEAQSQAPNNEAYQPPVIKKEPKKHNGVSLPVVVLCIVLSAIIGAGSGVTAMMLLKGDTVKQNSSSVASGSGGTVNYDVQNVEATIGVAVAEKVTPSVVGIRTTVSINNFFGGTQESSGEGSGVIYTSDGYIITNYHVISDAIEYSGNKSAIQVFLSNDSETGYDATVVGYNITCDLAVLKINGKDLTAIEVADSSALHVGEYVMAVGNPGGLEFMGSATYGIISGLNRSVSSGNDGTSMSLIQTDAAINPGNSGGALVNINGELIGINSSKLVSESIEGMGFAIPSNTVKEICDKIIARENKPTPYIGVSISERYDPETLEYYGYPTGAVIYSVASGSPAYEAGLRKGDIITELNGIEITHYSVLYDVLADCEVGETVSIKIYRSGRTYDGSITIGSNNS